MRQHRESPIARTNPSGARVWVARHTAPDGKRRSAGTYRLKRDAQTAIDNAYQQPATAETVAAYLDRWLETRPRSPRTDRTNHGRIRNVLDISLEGRGLADWNMSDLRRRHRDELTARLLTDQQRSPGGARNILRALSAMFEDAITDELANINPWRGAKVRDDDRRAQTRSRVLRVWSFDQMHDFAATSGRHEPMVRVLADCGLRIGELFALRRDDLSDGGMVVRGTAWEGQVTGDTNEKRHSREVPVPPGCLAVIRQMPTRIDTPWLFPSPAGKLWRYSNFLRRVWQPTCRAAGIDPTPHEFRHSWVTHLRAAGVDPADLAAAAGHSVQTAHGYTHPLGRSHDDIRRAVG